MLKTIAAALFAATVLAAPAMAGGYGRTVHQPEFRGVYVNPNVLNSHARWGRHHNRHHYHHRYFRHHHRFHHHH